MKSVEGQKGTDNNVKVSPKGRKGEILQKEQYQPSNIFILFFLTAKKTLPLQTNEKEQQT